MKKFSILLVVFLLALTCLGLAGCGGKQDTGSQPATGSQTAKEEPVTGLFAKGKQIEGMSFDYTFTSKAETMAGKYWMQGDKFKSEVVVEGRKMITLVDGNTLYSYDPEQNMAVKLTSLDNKVETPLDYSKDAEAKQDKLKVIEKSTVYDGIKCSVLAVTGTDGKEQMKMWVSEDYGIPIRVEVTEPDGSKSVAEYKNIKVGAQPPETFKLPAGAQITDLSEMMKQMPQMPGGKQ